MRVLLLFSSIASLHPFHVSVTEIKYKKEKKTIQISTRIFLDDMEMALRAATGNEMLNITLEEDWGSINVALKDYIMDHLKIYNAKGQMDAKYVGAEIERDVIWIYTEVEKVKELKTVRVANSLLTEAYNDQENIVHFRAHGKVRSARLNRADNEEIFVWE